MVVDGACASCTVFRELGARRSRCCEREGDDYWVTLRCTFGGRGRAALRPAAGQGAQADRSSRSRSGWIDLQASALDAAVASAPRRGEGSRSARTTPYGSRHGRCCASRGDSGASARARGRRRGGRGPRPACCAARRRSASRALRRWPAQRAAPLPAERPRLAAASSTTTRLAGLLCDDMGLGKTHQVMALLLSLVEQRGGHRRPSSSSARPRWSATGATSSAATRRGWPLTIYHGAGADAAADRRRRAHVVVTSYGVLRNDLERAGRAAVRRGRLRRDPAPQEPDTLAHRAAAELPAGMKLGLSGTPVENDLGELKALIDLVLPGYLGADREFVERHGPAAGARRPREALKRRLAPFVLRRLKAAVLDELPEKIEDVRTLRPLGRAAPRSTARCSRRAARAAARAARSARPSRCRTCTSSRCSTCSSAICDHPALAAQPAGATTRSSSSRQVGALPRDPRARRSTAGRRWSSSASTSGCSTSWSATCASVGLGFVTLTGATVERGRVVDRFNGDADCRVFLGSLKAGRHRHRPRRRLGRHPLRPLVERRARGPGHRPRPPHRPAPRRAGLQARDRGHARGADRPDDRGQTPPAGRRGGGRRPAPGQGLHAARSCSSC